VWQSSSSFCASRYSSDLSEWSIINEELLGLPCQPLGIHENIEPLLGRNLDAFNRGPYPVISVLRIGDVRRLHQNDIGRYADGCLEVSCMV
jgi:hypothetical protein